MIFLASRNTYGVTQMAKRFKRKQNRGNRTSKIRIANRSFIRVIFQNLESIGLVEKTDKTTSGRTLTREGMRFVDKCAVEAVKL